MITVVVPGEPVAQGRPRFSRFSAGKPIAIPRAIEPEKSRSWKGAAQVHMREALGATSPPLFPAGPLELRVLAVFTCPKSDHRKREPVGQRPKATRPDLENVCKAIQDAGTGLLWLDDSQIARLVADKVLAAQGDAPRVELTVKPLA